MNFAIRNKFSLFTNAKIMILCLHLLDVRRQARTTIVFNLIKYIVGNKRRKERDCTQTVARH